MYVAPDFDPIDPGEVDNFAFNFTPDLSLADGEVIVSAAWTCSVASGTDAGASSRLIGPPINMSAITTQTVGNCLGGVLYLLEAAVQTSFGRTLSLWSHVPCDIPN